MKSLSIKMMSLNDKEAALIYLKATSFIIYLVMKFYSNTINVFATFSPMLKV